MTITSKSVASMIKKNDEEIAGHHSTLNHSSSMKSGFTAQVEVYGAIANPTNTSNKDFK